MRLSFLYVSAVLAAGLALSACSSGAGSSSTLPSSGTQAIVKGQSHGHHYEIRLAPGSSR